MDVAIQTASRRTHGDPSPAQASLQMLEAKKEKRWRTRAKCPIHRANTHSDDDAPSHHVRTRGMVPA